MKKVIFSVNFLCMFANVLGMQTPDACKNNQNNTELTNIHNLTPKNNRNSTELISIHNLTPEDIDDIIHFVDEEDEEDDSHVFSSKRTRYFAKRTSRGVYQETKHEVQIYTNCKRRKTTGSVSTDNNTAGPVLRRATTCLGDFVQHPEVSAIDGFSQPTNVYYTFDSSPTPKSKHRKCL